MRTRQWEKRWMTGMRAMMVQWLHVIKCWGLVVWVCTNARRQVRQINPQLSPPPLHPICAAPSPAWHRPAPWWPWQCEWPPGAGRLRARAGPRGRAGGAGRPAPRCAARSRSSAHCQKTSSSAWSPQALRRRASAAPSRPKPTNAIEAGSGTWVGPQLGVPTMQPANSMEPPLLPTL